MENNLEKLQSIDHLLAKLIDGHDLTSEETERLHSTISLYDTEGYHYAIFLAGLHTKGETADELFGYIESFRKLVTPLKIKVDTDRMIDLSGTGGGAFKTINVSTAASFVVAAAGYIVAKASNFGITSPTGSVDIFAAFGIYIAKLNKEKIEKTLEKIGICPFYVPYFSPKLANRGKISRKVFGERKVKIRTPSHLVFNVFSPLPLTHRIYGCYSEKYLDILANLFMKLKFQRSLIFHGRIGMPEISNVGETVFIEQNKNRIKKYILKPKDLGIKEVKIRDFIRVLKGEGSRGKTDLIAINAGAAFYALEDVLTIKAGFKKAREILRSGKSYLVLKKLVNKLGDVKLLRNLEESLL